MVPQHVGLALRGHSLGHLIAFERTQPIKGMLVMLLPGQAFASPALAPGLTPGQATPPAEILRFAGRIAPGDVDEEDHIARRRQRVRSMQIPKDEILCVQQAIALRREAQSASNAAYEHTTPNSVSTTCIPAPPAELRD